MLLCGLRIILYFPHNIIIIHGAQRAADACLTNDGETIWDRTGPRWQVSIQAPRDRCYTLLELKRVTGIRSRKTIAGYDAVITDQELQPCALKCQRCNHLISPCNSSQSIKQHDGRCTGPAQLEDELMEEEDPDEGAGGSPKKRKARQLPTALIFQHPSSSGTATRSSCALMLSSQSRSWTTPEGPAGVSWGAA